MRVHLGADNLALLLEDKRELVQRLARDGDMRARSARVLPWHVCAPHAERLSFDDATPDHEDLKPVLAGGPEQLVSLGDDRRRNLEPRRRREACQMPGAVCA